MTLMPVPDFRHMTYGDMRRWATSHHILVGSGTLRHSIQGAYDDENRAIVIDRGMSYTQKRCTFVHEWIHWTHRDTGCGSITDSRAENRARRLTAQLLIDPLEYASAENMYDGDTYRIASELDVTHQVVLDYQAHLDNHL